jgi:RimJ/RimL family protein N-acetyltransferase
VKELDIRYSELEDEPALLSWMKDPNVEQWFPSTGEKETQFLVKNWIGFSRFKASLTGVIDNKVVAIGTLFLMPYRKVAHHCQFYLIVDPQRQKNGIGSSMLKNLIHLAKSYFHLEMMHAEIMEHCPLEKLLHTFHFNQAVKQDGYYKIGKDYFARSVFELSLKEDK